MTHGLRNSGDEKTLNSAFLCFNIFMTEKWKRNQIFEAIRAAGLDPIDFSLEDSVAEFRVNHKLSGSYFIVGGNASHYVGRHIAGDGPEWPYDAYSWEAVLTHVSAWLRALKLDLETPDLWSELQREAELLGGVSNEANANTPFTLEEQKEIARRLQEWAEYAKRTYSLSERKMQILNAKLDYLVGAAGRLGRIDWLNAVVGAILGFILTAALSPESARHLFFEFLRAIGHLFGYPALPGD
jgi:hypothetical protein